MMEPIAEVCCQDATWASGREMAWAGPGVREGGRSPGRGAVKDLGEGVWGLRQRSSVEGRDCLVLPTFPGGAPQTPSSMSGELGCVSPAVPGLQGMVGCISVEGVRVGEEFQRQKSLAEGAWGNLGTQGCTCKPPGPPSRLGRWCLEFCTQSLKPQVGDSPWGTDSFPASPDHFSGYEFRYWDLTAWVQIPALPPTSDKSLYLSLPQFSHL